MWLLIAATMIPLLKTAVVEPKSVHRQLDMNATSQETPVIREYFYVGGRYVDDGTGTGQHIFQDQMYVEKLRLAISCPKASPISPLVFIHGQGQTGTVSLFSQLAIPGVLTNLRIG
jgi:hypothetical protein